MYLINTSYKVNMNKQMWLHGFMESEKKRYQNLYHQLLKDKASLTDGALIDRNGTYYRFIRQNGKQYSVPIEDVQLMDEIKKNRYVWKSLPILEKKIRLCENFLTRDIYYDPKQIEADLPQQYSNIQDLGLYLPDDVVVEKWAESPYRKNSRKIKEPSYTANGLKVRSKSESIIGTRLEEKGIFFRYEQELILAGETFYPDFLILLPNRRRLIYWEHFGKMDDPDYAAKTIYKIDKYCHHGIHSGINFFMTYETKSKPFGFVDADRMINSILALDKSDFFVGQ